MFLVLLPRRHSRSFESERVNEKKIEKKKESYQSTNRIIEEKEKRKQKKKRIKIKMMEGCGKLGGRKLFDRQGEIRDFTRSKRFSNIREQTESRKFFHA